MPDDLVSPKVIFRSRMLHRRGIRAESRDESGGGIAVRAPPDVRSPMIPISAKGVWQSDRSDHRRERAENACFVSETPAAQGLNSARNVLELLHI